MIRLNQPIRFAWRVPDLGTHEVARRVFVELQLLWGGHQQVVARFDRPDLSPSSLHLAALDLTPLNELWDDPIDNMAWLVHAAHIFCSSVQQAPSLTSENWLRAPRPWPHPVDSINEVLRATRGHLVLKEQMVTLLSLAGVPPSEREEKIAYWQCRRHDPFGEACIDGDLKLRALVESAALPSRELVTDWPDSALKDALRLAHNWYAERTFGGVISPCRSHGTSAAATEARSRGARHRDREGLPTCSLCGENSSTTECVVGATYVMCRSCFADALHHGLVRTQPRPQDSLDAQACANCTAPVVPRRGMVVTEALTLCASCTSDTLLAFLE